MDYMLYAICYMFIMLYAICMLYVLNIEKPILNFFYNKCLLKKAKVIQQKLLESAKNYKVI